MQKQQSSLDVPLSKAVMPILFLLGLMIYGLAIHPRLTATPAALGGTLPLELIFILAIAFNIVNLKTAGYCWDDIQTAMIKKVTQTLPAVFILFSIGVLIGSWVVSGTIPMMIYYGITLINTDYLYLIAFIVPSIFSLFTGTSWGSAGTIGVVLLSVGRVLGADEAIIAGAVVGGAYFGDKISPLSDTTNVAALAAETDLYQHIRSMLNTTGPAYLLAALAYTAIGFLYPIAHVDLDNHVIVDTQQALQAGFRFSLWLMLPIAIVLVGSLMRRPTVPTLWVSALVAAALGLIVQGFSFIDVATSLNKGFSTGMLADFPAALSPEIAASMDRILNRGGLYNLIDAIVICLCVFMFIGTLDLVNAINRVVDRLFAFVHTRRAAVVSALTATAATNALTSNQFATSFVVAAAFKDKFDNLRIRRNVLSRCLEDTGTMLESMLPWTTTGIYMASVLQVAVMDYNQWQLLSLFNFAIAYLLAMTGIGCFYSQDDRAASAHQTSGEEHGPSHH